MQILLGKISLVLAAGVEQLFIDEHFREQFFDVRKRRELPGIEAGMMKLDDPLEFLLERRVKAIPKPYEQSLVKG